jgi:hypothetical protein
MGDGATRLNWGKLLSNERLPKQDSVCAFPREADPDWIVANRTEAERDFDRILFHSHSADGGQDASISIGEK